MSPSRLNAYSYTAAVQPPATPNIVITLGAPTLSELVKPESDPSGGSLNAPGKKGDAGKIQAWLFMSGFSRALREVAKVTTVGAQKYTRGGWETVPNGSERYMEAFGRHLFDLGSGQVFDNALGGTGCYHKANMIWNLLASLELDLREASNKK